MKTQIVLLISLSVLFFQCTSEENTKSPIWGVDFSTENATGFAQGSIEQQNAGDKVIHIANSGYLRETEEEDIYTVAFTFENGSSMQLHISKKTADLNYHFPGQDSENQLLSAVFNGVALDLAASSIAVQPNLGENKLHVVTNVHTLNSGDYNGTLTRVPLLK